MQGRNPYTFYARIADYGRFVMLVVTTEADEWTIYKLAPSQQLARDGLLEGSEDATTVLSRAEGQQLLDVLWEAGLRPTRV